MIHWIKNNPAYVFLGVIFVALAVLFVFAGLEEKGGSIAGFLGMTKKEAMEFIALGMGGALTAIGLVALNRRANAQVRNNELIERGHIEERFKSATESLGHNKASVRIAAFYQFYHFAKFATNERKKEIFEILCAHLRDTTRQESYRTGVGEKKPTEECQSLLHVLFRMEGKSIFSEFPASMWNIYLVGADLSDAQMSGAALASSDLRDANFDSADLRAAFMVSADMRKTRFVKANLQYVDMINSNLKGANLGKANMRYSQVSCAEFNGANLAVVDFRNAGAVGVDFSGAHVSGADFRGAALRCAIFRGVRGLDTAKFDKGVKDIILKHGKVPDDHHDPQGTEVVLIAKGSRV